MTVNCQVGSSFTEDVSDQANYVNNFNPRLTNEPFLNAHIPSWKNHPISHIDLTLLLFLASILDHPLDFKDRLIPNKPLKCSLEGMMENMLLA